MQAIDLYKRYTSTQSLVIDCDETEFLKWSKGYFRSNYSNKLPTIMQASVLEIGCGCGRYLSALGEMGYVNSYGIDLSSEQVNYAKEVLQLRNVEEADVFEWLSGKEGVFDCILAIDILEHFPTDDLLKLGSLILQALKPGGTVIFQVPNGMSPLSPVIYGDLTHVRAFTPQSMQQFLLYSGFIPAGNFEVPPYVHGAKSALQRILWSVVVKPLFTALISVLHGRVFGGCIISSNFVVCASKPS